MKRFMTKKVAVIGIAAGLTLGIAGGAFAYFSSTGTGSGTATAGTSAAFTVSVPNTAIGDLTPTTLGTGPSDTLDYSITNPSSGAQELNQAVISISSVTAGTVSGPNACTAADFSVGGELAGVSHTVTIGQDLAASGVYNDTVTLQLIDNGLNQDQCQGATVTLNVAAS
jgi:hypothetical protein